MRCPRAILAILCCGPAGAWGQEAAGEGRIFSQSYQQGGWNGAPGAISGLGLHLRYVTPKLGTLTVHSEGYGQSTGARLGISFLHWDLPQWRGRQWRVTAGDFDVPSSPLVRPFFNVYFPNLIGTGAHVEARGRTSSYYGFAGTALLYEGPRISLRTSVPQMMSGGGLRLNPTRWLQFGATVLRFNNDPEKLPTTPFERNSLGLQSSTQATAQALFTVHESLKFFTEATGMAPKNSPTAPSGTEPVRRSAGYVAGLVYLTSKITLRANFIDQARGEMPLLQTRSGDRRGPFGELSFRPFPELELFASGSAYRSHSTRDFIRATSVSGGLHLQLPWRFDFTGSLTQIRASTPAFETRNRQLTLVLSRPIHHSTVRFWLRELQLWDPVTPSSQRSYEIESTHLWRRLVASGAVRLQQTGFNGGRSTLFGREQVQFQLNKFTVFQNFEYGRDLASDTLFATNSFQTTSAGVSYRPTRLWSIDAELFRNRLATFLNPVQEFILGGNGQPGTPLLLAGFNQWTLFVRVSRTFAMGPALSTLPGRAGAPPGGGPALTGSIDGFVREASQTPVAGIAVQLDEDRLDYTDDKGRYRFLDVPDGPHSLRLAPRELPAEYDAAVEKDTAVVKPGRAARLDFVLHVLGSLSGQVATAGGVGIGAAIIRLQPTGRTTLTADDGTFQFHNLRLGDYSVALEEPSLPPRHKPVGETEVKATVEARKDSPAIRFRIRIEPEKPKPIRVVFP